MKRRSSSRSIPLAGVFTRRRAEIFIHRTRSGRSWSDLVNKVDVFSEQSTTGDGKSIQSTIPDVDIIRQAEKIVIELDHQKKTCDEELVQASGEKESIADVGFCQQLPCTLNKKPNSSQTPKAASDTCEISYLEELQLCDSRFYPTAKSANIYVGEITGNTLDNQSSGLTCKEPNPVEYMSRRSDPGNHFLAPKKSILKKHTRGCKGLCMCHGCASLRLRTKRAYEFSRRQILEADEIATTLMKEISLLRKFVDKSYSPQAKEVCRRVLKVEQAAKYCMCHLLRETRMHCRLPGPRLTFADPIGEIQTLEFAVDGDK